MRNTEAVTEIANELLIEAREGDMSIDCNSAIIAAATIHQTEAIVEILQRAFMIGDYNDKIPSAFEKIAMELEGINQSQSL